MSQTGGTSLDLEVTVDNVHASRGRVISAPRNRKRIGNVSFEVQRPSDGPSFYWVRAWGDLFPAEGPEYKGKLKKDEHSVFAAITRCREVWQKAVIELKVPNEHGASRFRFPFADQWDLNTPQDKDRLDQVGRELARAGNVLFRYLFRQRDDELRRIADLLEQGLRSNELVLAFHSDDLFAPWWMLYTPPDPGTDLDDPDAPWSLEGFWGYQHLIEHQFSRLRSDTRIIIRDGRVHVGLNVDTRLDEAYMTPFVESIVAFFRAVTNLCTCTVREEKPQLALAIKSADFRDEVIYFGCHGSVSGREGASTTQAKLTLTDGLPIHTDEFCAWLNERPMGAFTTNPVVFVNACQGGQMSSHFYTSFGFEFIRHGANCLIGPQVDIPAKFAAQYATRLFEEFLKPGTRLGDVVRRLAREFAMTHRNPLGLVFSLYRGLDSHLVVENGSHLIVESGQP